MWVKLSLRVFLNKGLPTREDKLCTINDFVKSLLRTYIVHDCIPPILPLSMGGESAELQSQLHDSDDLIQFEVLTQNTTGGHVVYDGALPGQNLSTFNHFAVWGLIGGSQTGRGIGLLKRIHG